MRPLKKLKKWLDNIYTTEQQSCVTMSSMDITTCESFINKYKKLIKEEMQKFIPNREYIKDREREIALYEIELKLSIASGRWY